VKIFIGLVTPDEALRRYYGLGKERVVPRGSISRGYFLEQEPSVAPAAYRPKNAPSTYDIEKWFVSRTKSTDACLLLVDTEWENFVENMRSASLSIAFRRDDIVSSNNMNFFHSIIGRLLRVFGSVASKFKNGDDRQLLTLPLRNFHAPELTQIARLCRDKCFDPNFNYDLDRQLSVLRTRRRPRKRSSSKVMYAVDDQSRFFVYGKETHARLGTGEPHKPHCELAGNFRFGQRIDALRHYNVSETEGDRTTIEGSFRDCHDTSHGVRGQTHLNMFSNDYFCF
jgi:hypothetical protein